MSSRSDAYSPLRPRTSGASTWKRVPSGSSSTRSTICCGRLAGHRPTADRAVRPADPGVEQAEVVVDLGDRPDRRPGVAGRRLLVDRDGRRQPLDEVDVRLVHLAEELAGVRGQRLDVAALALGVDRVEGQRRLAGAGEAGEDDEAVAGQVERDVLEVVLAGSPNDEAVGHTRRIPVGRTPAIGDGVDCRTGPPGAHPGSIGEQTFASGPWAPAAPLAARRGYGATNARYMSFIVKKLGRSSALISIGRPTISSR